MSDDTKDTAKANEFTKDAELAESELYEVAGGLNPQPEPPGKTIVYKSNP
jgi:hypothetical protein